MDIPTRDFTVRLQMRRKLYTAVVAGAKAAHQSLDAFCGPPCIADLHLFATSFPLEGHGIGSVEKARFVDNGRDITALITVSPDLRISLFERAKDTQFERTSQALQMAMEKTCRELCRSALAEAVGVTVDPTMGEE